MPMGWIFFLASHLHLSLIFHLTTLHPLTQAPILRLPTFSFGERRCLHQILMCCFRFGVSMPTSEWAAIFQGLQVPSSPTTIFILLLTRSHSAMHHSIASRQPLLQICLPQHLYGRKRSIRFGIVIQTSCYTTCWLILT